MARLVEPTGESRQLMPGQATRLSMASQLSGSRSPAPKGWQQRRSPTTSIRGKQRQRRLSESWLKRLLSEDMLRSAPHQTARKETVYRLPLSATVTLKRLRLTLCLRRAAEPVGSGWKVTTRTLVRHKCNRARKFKPQRCR